MRGNREGHDLIFASFRHVKKHISFFNHTEQGTTNSILDVRNLTRGVGT
jgi:hypothetical protein